MARVEAGRRDGGTAGPDGLFSSCCAGLYELPIAQLLLGDSFHPGGLDTTRRLIDMMAVGRGDLVLDVACGVGTSARFLNRDRGIDVIGLDVSVPGLRKVRRDGKRQLHPVAGTALDLPLAAGSVDGVLCECALCTFGSTEKALREAYRVLKPGAYLGISDMTISNAVPDDLKGLLGHALCISGALSGKKLEDAIRRAGFATVRTRDATSTLLKMTESIEKRLNALQLSADADLELPDYFEDAGRVLASARDFIASGGLQYGLFAARKVL